MTRSISSRLRAAVIAYRTGKVSPAINSYGEISPLTGEEIAEAQAFFPLKKFFIFGHARSGTTLLTRLIRLHPEVHCNYQAHFFTRPPLLQSLVSDPEVREWLSRRSNRWNRGRDLSPVLLRAAADFILEREARKTGKTIVGDKSPNNLLNGESVRLMHRIYPDGTLIFIVRDGRDAALSHRIQGFIDFPEQLGRDDLKIREDFGRNPAEYLGGKRSLFTERGLRAEAENWTRNVEETDSLGKEKFGDRYISMRYEDLLENPWEQMSKLWIFLGADPEQPELKDRLELEMSQNPDADYQHRKAGDIAQALQKGKRGTWQEIFTARDRDIFSGVAGDTLNKWGYR